MEPKMQNLDLDDYIKLFEEIYEPIKNAERDFYQTVARLLESIAKCSQHVNRSHEIEIAKQLPTLFAWYCSLVIKAEPRGFSLSEIMWRKYPNCCPYCLTSPCICPRNKKSLIDNTQKLLEKAIQNEDKRPHTLSEWQDMFSRIYPRNPQGYEQKSNFMHLIEEIGETAEAYRLNYFYPENLGNELADVLTWIFGIANLIDAKAKDNPYTLNGEAEYNLEKKVLEKYGKGCPKCNQPHCNCITKDVQDKISERFKLYPNDVYVQLNKLIMQMGTFRSEIYNDLKELSKGQEITNENLQELVLELIEKSKEKRWYQKISASGITENALVSAISLLVQSIMQSG